MAAATYPARSGGRRIALFVDGVEGRFDVKPKLIKRAIEDYAGAAGFDAVFYFKHPLNMVPQRFVRFVESVNASVEEIAIEYVDHSDPEYLDSFGYPFEPFEYALPSGKVIGHFVALDEKAEPVSTTPGKAEIFWSKAKKKYLLYFLPTVPLLYAVRVGWGSQPIVVAALLIVFGTVLFYQFYLDRRSCHDSGKPKAPSAAAARAIEKTIATQPAFLQHIREEIGAIRSPGRWGILPGWRGRSPNSASISRPSVRHLPGSWGKFCGTSRSRKAT